MNRMTSILFASAAIAFAPAAMAQDASSAPQQAEDRATLVTEFKGRPPFARKRIDAEEIASLARFEETTVQKMTRVDYSGRPPYRRHGSDASVSSTADFARFEETADASARPRRFGPPGKNTSRR